MQRMKVEILSLIQGGRIPATVRTYGELHDYIDANGLGGAFYGDAPLATDPIWDDTQCEIDAWLRAGRPEIADEDLSCPQCLGSGEMCTLCQKTITLCTCEIPALCHCGMCQGSGLR